MPSPHLVLEVVRPPLPLVPSSEQIARAAIVLSIGPLVVAFLAGAFGPRTMSMCGETKEDTARITALKYVHEAYPTWVAENPRRTCPVSLDELSSYMNNKYSVDPWGYFYRFSCSSKGLVVWSVGPDGRNGTADDERSDR